MEKIMPIFEYKCKKCGTVFEIFIGQIKCPKCGSEEAERVLSTFSFDMNW